MKRTAGFLSCMLLLFAAGCAQDQSAEEVSVPAQESAEGWRIGYTYPWRRAYTEFLWDKERLCETLRHQLAELLQSPDNALLNSYLMRCSFVCMDADDNPELLVSFPSAGQPGSEYYALYRYQPDGTIGLWCSGCVGYGLPQLSYLPYQGAFVTSSYSVMGGLTDYTLYVLEADEWKDTDSCTEEYREAMKAYFGVSEPEHITDELPSLRGPWRSPECWVNNLSEQSGSAYHALLLEMLGSDAAAGLPADGAESLE